mmetsp:Transcript_5121/g.5255  ORF Transcript_5121/g.5255 Transcript_5121/m.5255 type:complete len:463 (-) Transcript_5121:364-1752(-)
MEGSEQQYILLLKDMGGESFNIPEPSVDNDPNDYTSDLTPQGLDILCIGIEQIEKKKRTISKCTLENDINKWQSVIKLPNQTVDANTAEKLPDIEDNVHDRSLELITILSKHCEEIENNDSIKNDVDISNNKKYVNEEETEITKNLNELIDLLEILNTEVSLIPPLIPSNLIKILIPKLQLKTIADMMPSLSENTLNSIPVSAFTRTIPRLSKSSLSKVIPKIGVDLLPSILSCVPKHLVPQIIKLVPLEIAPTLIPLLPLKTLHTVLPLMPCEILVDALPSFPEYVLLSVFNSLPKLLYPLLIPKLPIQFIPICIPLLPQDLTVAIVSEFESEIFNIIIPLLPLSSLQFIIPQLSQELIIIAIEIIPKTDLVAVVPLLSKEIVPEILHLIPPSIIPIILAKCRSLSVSEVIEESEIFVNIYRSKSDDTLSSEVQYSLFPEGVLFEPFMCETDQSHDSVPMA